MDNKSFMQFTGEIREYLSSKLTGYPQDAIEEIAACIGYKTIIFTTDMIQNRDVEWRKMIVDTNRPRRGSRISYNSYNEDGEAELNK